MFTSNSHFCISGEDVKRPTGAAIVIFPRDDLIFRIRYSYQPDCMSLFYSPLGAQFSKILFIPSNLDANSMLKWFWQSTDTRKHQ